MDKVGNKIRDTPHRMEMELLVEAMLVAHNGIKAVRHPMEPRRMARMEGRMDGHERCQKMAIEGMAIEFQKVPSVWRKQIQAISHISEFVLERNPVEIHIVTIIAYQARHDKALEKKSYAASISSILMV